MDANLMRNKSILCVDDEEGMLESYRQILVSEEEDIFAGILDSDDSAENVLPAYDLYLARSGEEAIEIVASEQEKGNQFAAGFFDMRMPGGMDGYQTIQEIRRIDPKILCAVVTAYTDRNVTQIQQLFPQNHQDELLYFKKPFTTTELKQTVLNMVCSWNRKRKEEEHIRVINNNRAGLKYILKAISELALVPPRSLQDLISGILFQMLVLINGQSGYIAILSNKGTICASHSAGRFQGKDLNQYIRTINGEHLIKTNIVLLEGTKCLFPLRYGERKLGAIYVESRFDLNKEELTEILEIFRNQLSATIMNSMFYNEILEKDQLVITDPLTGLYNRRFLMKRLKEVLSHSSRYSLPISILMIDLDDFKKINDNYGHDAGDYLLVELSKLLQKAVRTYDVIARNVDTTLQTSYPMEPIDEMKYAIRFGGEEFTIILAQTDLDGAYVVAERIRQWVNEQVFCYEDVQFQITASIGIGTGIASRDKGEQGEFLEFLIKKADDALYLAKKKGKNRVEAYLST